MPATLRTFATPDEFFESVFGPRQHDAHIIAHRQHAWLTRYKLAMAAADARVQAATEKLIRAERARRESNRAAMVG